MTDTAATVACRHCGTPFEAESQGQEFCCAGCSFVHDLIASSGLERFYDLKGAERILPAGNAVLAKVDTAWAAPLQQEAEAKCQEGAMPQLKLDLQGVSCIGCVWLIDALFQQQPGAGRILVDASRGEAVLRWLSGQFHLPEFAEELAKFGYRLAPSTGGDNSASASGLRLGLAGGLALNAMAFTLPRYLGMAASFQFASLFEMVAAFSATMSLLLCGSYFIGRAWGALKAGRLHIDVPIAGGVLAAWLGSVIGWLTGSASLLYFDFVAVFIFLMLTGRRLQEVSVARNRNRLLRADPLLRSVAVFSPDAPGAPPSDRPLDALEKGTLFAVPPAGVAPVSAQLLDEEAALSLEWINGESESRVWRRGAHIPAGAVNLGQSPVRLAAREAWSDSLLHTLTNPSDAAAAADNPAARWLDRTLRVYLGVVIALALLGGLGWWLGGAAWPVALQVTISVLVVSCPCALGVAIPMSHELAVGALRRGGLFVRKPDVWGRLLRVRDIVFDKTGTLTLDAPRLRNPSLIPGLQPPERRALAHLVMESRHPLSASLREALATHKALQNGAPQPVEESPGQGLRYTDDAGTVWALRRPETQESGDAIFSRNGAALAAFSFEDAVRPDAAREIALLRRRGHEIYLLSGDREEKVLRMARDLGVPESQALARQTPEQKAEWIAAHGSHCLFVGDGANDSLAADAALVIGTPAVERCLIAEKADFYFLCRGLRPIRALFEIAACRRRAVVRAVTFALAYNAAVVALSLLGRMNPLLAAILMPLSSLATLLIVTLSLRKAG